MGVSARGCGGTPRIVADETSWRRGVVTSLSRRRTAVRALSAGATQTEASQSELELLIVHVMPGLVSDYTCPRAAFHRPFSVLCIVCPLCGLSVVFINNKFSITALFPLACLTDVRQGTLQTKMSMPDSSYTLTDQTLLRPLVRQPIDTF